MNRELLGVILAVLASLSFESGYQLMTQQSRLVERSGRPGGRFLLSLLHRPLWLLAIALSGAGILLELFALREVSLIVVQPLMSVGLIGLVFAARVFLGERIDRHPVLAAGALVSGVACVILAAPSDADAVRLAHPVASILVLGALAVIVISAYLGRGRARSRLRARATGTHPAGESAQSESASRTLQEWRDRDPVRLKIAP